MKQILCIGTLLFGSLAILGCGEKTEMGMEKRATQPANGIVTYKGSPLRDASVSFISLDGKIRSHGQTDGVASFILSTYGQQDGVPPGKYKVIVAVNLAKEIEPGVLADEPPGGFKSPIPMKYANPSTTDILVEVKESGKNEFVIELK